MQTTTTTSSLGFNKRRAEGRDKRDTFKSFPLKTAKLNPVNTASYIQILGNGMDTQDTSPSVLLFFDKQRFIFNAGEGLQRYCMEHKIKLSKIDHIFHSRVCSETVGGLPGLLLTLAGMGKEGMSVKVWGPSDLKYLIDAMMSFIPNDVVHPTYFSPESMGKFSDPIELIDDEVVKISAILIRPSSNIVSQHKKDHTELVLSSVGSDEGIRRPLGPLLPHSNNPKRDGGTMLKLGDISVIYVCELPEIKGKFNPKAAQKLGLKSGPKYRELQLGNSVMSDEQNLTIYPNNVLGSSIPGPIVLLVDCPTLSHLLELLSIQSLRCYYSDSVEQQSDVAKSVNCIVHLSPSSVTMTDTYQKWMRRFGGAQHIMAGHDIKNMEIPILKASARISARLNYLCPQFFPVPGFQSSQHLINFVPESNALNEGSVPKHCDSILAENLLKFHLRPCIQLGPDRSEVPSLLSQKEIVDELISEIPEIVDHNEQVKQLWDDEFRDTKRAPMRENVEMLEEPWMNSIAPMPKINLGLQNVSNFGEVGTLGVKGANLNEDEHECPLPSCLDNITREDMEIVLLGTGASQPSKYRNVSSIYVNLFSKGGILLDSGEATLAQLIRRYGQSGANDAVTSLRCIWISHIHADHHSGLFDVLLRRCKLLDGTPHEPVLVIGPRQLKICLDACQKFTDLDIHFLDCAHTEASLTAFESAVELTGSSVDIATHLKSLKKLKTVLEELGLEALVSIPVVHCPQAFGVVVKAAERNNIMGKTIPGWKLVYSGDTRPCSKLINAARGATVLIHEATFENSMLEEAIARNHSTTKEAIQVGESAGAYRIILTHFSQRYPKIPVLDEAHMQKTCIGFDLMSINMADLQLLPKIMPHLKLLFRDEMISGESDGTVGPSL